MNIKQYNEFYDRAFKNDYLSLWIRSPYVLSNQDYHEMSYARANKVFIASDPESITDRKKLLVEFARPMLSSMSNTDWTSIFPVLPITSSVTKIQNQRCTLYADAPQRQFGENDDLMSKIYSNSDFELMMPEIYMMAKSTGSVLINPIFRDGKLHLNYLTSDMYRVEVDEANPLKIKKVIYPFQPNINEDKYGFYIWTDDSIEIWSNNSRLEYIDNPYGEIPFVFLHLGHRDLSVSKLSFGNIELVHNQLERNLIEFLSRNNLIYQGLPTTLVENVGEGFHSIIPGQVVVSEVTNQDSPGAIVEYVAPSAVYEELNSYSLKLFNQELDRYEIPQFNEEKLSGLSGISRAMLRQNLIQERKKDLVKLTKCEKELAELIYLKYCIDSNTIYKENYIQFQINFVEEQTFNDPIAERAEDEKLMQEGMISPLTYYRKWSEVDSNCTEDELLEQLKNNFELLDKIKNISKKIPDVAPVDDVAPDTTESKDEQLAQSLEDEKDKILNI